MKKWFVLISVVFGLSVINIDSRAGDPAQFKIDILVTDTGVELVCDKGCAWTELSFSCDGGTPCSSGIDQNGMTE